MPLERFRSVEDMPSGSARRTDPLDALDRMVALTTLVVDGLPPLHQQGIYRYRSVVEADMARDRATLRRLRATSRR